VPRYSYHKLIEVANRKVTKKIIDLFDLYIECSRVFTFFGGSHDHMIWHEDGVTALQGFNAQDSMGLDVPCNQPFLLKKALDGKAGLNFQIKQWAEGIVDGISLLHELQRDFPWLPEWVWEAVVGQSGCKHNIKWYWDMKSKKPSESDVEATYRVQPPQTNMYGTAFGGKIMEWMDVTAGIAASRHCRKTCVTASVDSIQFAHPIKMGDIVVLKTRVNYVGKTSMEVGAKIYSENPLSGVRKHCLSGYLTFVAIDENGKPVEVPKIIPQSEEDKRRFKDAERRRKIRLDGR